jgi:hypothetical protein
MKLHLDSIECYLYLYDTSGPTSRRLASVGSVVDRVHWVGVALVPALRGSVGRAFASGGRLPQVPYWLA